MLIHRQVVVKDIQWQNWLLMISPESSSQSEGHSSKWPLWLDNKYMYVVASMKFPSMYCQSCVLNSSSLVWWLTLWHSWQGPLTVYLGLCGIHGDQWPLTRGWVTLPVSVLRSQRLTEIPLHQFLFPSLFPSLHFSETWWNLPETMTLYMYLLKLQITSSLYLYIILSGPYIISYIYY